MLDRPELDFRQAYYYGAFQTLSSSRNAGMSGAMPIPISEIRAYCEFFYIAKLDERDRLLRYVKSLDSAYLDWVAEQMKNSRK